MCADGPNNPWNESIPLYVDYDIVEQPVNLHTICDRYADETISFMQNMTNPTINPTKAPFFAYVAFSGMHSPIVHNPRWNGKTGKGEYADALYELDFNVGRIVSYLERSGLINNTLVVLTGDNGPAGYECQFGGSVGPFLGLWQTKGPGGGGIASKLTVWEGGHREPGLVYWPGKVTAGRVSDALLSQMDLFVTFSRLAGAPLPPNRTFDGMDISHILFGNSQVGHTTLFHPNSGGFGPHGVIGAVRASHFKGVYFTGGGATACNGGVGPGVQHNPPLIFDLRSDPAEAHPVQPSDQRYNAALRQIQAASNDFRQSLRGDMISRANTDNDPTVMACCNPKNPVCRCSCSPT